MSLRKLPLFVLPVVAAASAATAADVSPVVVPAAPAVAPVVLAPDTLIQVEGGPVFSPFGIEFATDDKFGDAASNRGFYLGAAVRRMFPSNIGVQAAVTGTWLSGYAEDVETELLSTMRFQTLDVDVGFHPGGDIRTRFFAGFRALHGMDALDLYQYGLGFDEAHSFATAWLVGPRAGMNADVRLGASRFSLVADVSASALFGVANVALDLIGGPVDASGFRMAFNVEGQLGLAWNPSENFALAFGYRAQQWWGLRQATEVETNDVFVAVSPDKLIHGPFVRLSLTY
ncbi:MAG: hypothetical protein IT534_03395 [Bauldia sp.]|nr:hypothetical protein [Bauldia sp.]